MNHLEKIEYVIPGDKQANKRNNTKQEYDERTHSGNDGNSMGQGHTIVSVKWSNRKG